MFILLLFYNLTIVLACQLPTQWTGNWYQNKDLDLLSINRTTFINRGTCIEHKEDKFVFYDRFEMLRVSSLFIYFYFLKQRNMLPMRIYNAKALKCASI